MEDPINTRIVMAVAEAKGVDPLDLPSLHDCIDPDAIEAFFGTDQNGAEANESVSELRFSYAGQEVSVRPGGQVTVGPPLDPA